MYVGRFAPSPTGPLHAGSLVAALASWLDARAHGGRWLIRIEDVDGPRCPPGLDRVILDQLAQCGLHPDEPPLWQSARGALYEQALATLQNSGWAYGCACSRKQISDALQALGVSSERHGELVYPGTCRAGLQGRTARAWRLRSTAELAGTQDLTLTWHDRRLGAQTQNLSREVGDFVLKRADGLWAYQLAVVVDDAAQDVTDIVRGADLADNTPRQIRLQQLLGLPTPRYLHTPLVLGADGNKLSKQNGAAALELRDAALALRLAASSLGLAIEGQTVAEVLAQAVTGWRVAFGGMMPATEPANLPARH
ncbi:tRNA glutamyl-Q(34) synthetase GluQRS [Paucibacter sp. B2R-40]|uniref:tRNA glutamyl-Q(34) synthetase GluQRS n=1 Tax=Paucibacter sp. B2R-40 TaxID=2893554 RepID=UPI0021E4C5C5|nr:tRNA glutamyl-Q(34) synthetase GluQRS [Paucibacter sp. B2R-40]MCV2356337.1 tRNA glutamyl-Q(34) synthetase GluQRS [Paucibacter sp. B2R-40]